MKRITPSDTTTKYNDEEMAKYATHFNTLCVKNNVVSFWWDTNLLVNRDELCCFQKTVDAIMECYKDFSAAHSGDNACGSNNACAASDPLTAYTKESAQECVSRMKCGWNLGNTLDAHKYKAVWNSQDDTWIEELKLEGLDTETCWREPKTTKEIIHYVKTLGFNAIRVPVTWIGHLEGGCSLDSSNGADPYKIDSAWMARVKQIVDWVLEEGMYCILNVHHDGGAMGWVRACESAYTKFSPRLRSIYSQMAETFKDYNQRLLFGGVNEMLDQHSSWAIPTDEASVWIDKWNQLFVDAIRASGGNNATRNLVIMAGAGKSNYETVAKFHLPKDSASGHMIFEFHNYDPQCFCWWQFSDSPDFVKSADETAFWSEEKHGSVLDRVFENIQVLQKELGVPFICGEYGAWPKEI